MIREHSHAEAFMIMEYSGVDKRGNTIIRRIWNSRDGVTPFSYFDEENELMLTHSNYRDDIYAPDHKPKRGDFIWVNHNEETAKNSAEKAYRLHLDELKKHDAKPKEFRSPTFEILRKMVSDKSKYIEGHIFALLGGNGEPQPLLVKLENDWGLKKVSKNIALGEPIADIRELARLANKRKSVVWSPKHGYYFVRPATFFLGWPLRQVMNAKLFYSIKINDTK